MASLQPADYKYSINEFPGDGVTLVRNISFAGGFISRDHIKAVQEDADQNLTNVGFTWLSDTQISMLMATPVGQTLRVYRDTPKTEPLADFADGAILTEKNLDTNARQAVFIAAEAADAVSVAVKGDQGLPGTDGTNGTDGLDGAVGAAANVFSSIAAAQAIDPTQYPAIVIADGSSPPKSYGYVAGNFSGRTDVIPLAGTPITSGGLVRPDASSVGFRQPGAGAAFLSAAYKLGERISVIDFGAVPGQDCTQAVQAAMKYASTVSSTHSGAPSISRIYFPAAKLPYMVSNKAFNPTTPTIGMTFEGDGWFATKIRLTMAIDSQGNPVEQWMFDNSDTDGLLLFPTFSNMAFEGCAPSQYDPLQVPTTQKFMKVVGTNPQGYRFTQCLCAGFDTVFYCMGQNCCSENKWMNCKIYACRDLLVLSNLQAFNHDFIGTEIEQIFGSAVRFVTLPGSPGAGGAVRIVGASLLMAGLSSIVNMSQGSMVNQGVVITGTRIEMRDNSRFFEGNPDLANGSLTMVDCGWLNTQTADAQGTAGKGLRYMGVVGPGQIVRFIRTEYSTLGQESVWAFKNLGGRYGVNGRYIWEDSVIPANHSDRIDLTGSTSLFGRATARDCRTDVGGVTNEIYAADFDIGGSAYYGFIGSNFFSSGGDANFRVKRVYFKNWSDSFPTASGTGGVSNESILHLPAYAMVTKVFVHRPAGGSSTAAYALAVTNGDKSQIIASQAAAPQNAGTTLVADFEAAGSTGLYEAGSLANTRTLRLTRGAGTDDAATEYWQRGYAYVEYI